MEYYDLLRDIGVDDSPYHIERFAVGYDNRPREWHYDERETVFPYNIAYTVVAEISGRCPSPFQSLQATFTPQLRVYRGADTANSSAEGQEPVGTVYGDEVMPDDDGSFSLRFVTDIKLPRPAKDGGVDHYTVGLYVNDQRVASDTLTIVRTPADTRLTLMPVKLETNVGYEEDGHMRTDCKLTVLNKLTYDVPITLGGYFAHLADGIDFFCEGHAAPVSASFCDALLPPRQLSTLEFHFLGEPFEQSDADAYLYFAQAADVFIKMPCFELQPVVGGGTLCKYLVSKNKAGQQPREQFEGRDDSVDTTLMPRALREYLIYIDKLATFREARGEDDATSRWPKRPLVFTGKRGTGKRTAAENLGRKLLDYGMSKGTARTEGHELLDPNAGFAQRLDDELGAAAGKLLIIDNAEALAMRPNANMPSGIEALAARMKAAMAAGTQVLLMGRRNAIEEMVNSCEQAREAFATIFHFDDVTPPQLVQLSLLHLHRKGYSTTPGARQRLTAYFERAYQLRGASFANMVFAQKTIDEEILPNVVRRVIDRDLNVTADLNLVTEADIPHTEQPDPAPALAKLQELVGLEAVKRSIIEHTSLVRLNKLRADHGLYNRMPPMHMVFTGNPGTGKTTVAKYLGEIYRGIGALASGHLVETDRSKLVGQYIGDTEKNTLNAIQQASGGVLFIDEAYNLFVTDTDKRDFGMRVIETLLTYLSNEQTDMIVILAGYTNEMKRMLESNPGLKSRFPYVFHFEDYSPEQLLGIGKLVLEREQYQLSAEAEQALTRHIIDAYNHKDEHFGNGRFITRLLTSHVIPAVSKRLMDTPAEEIDARKLSTIEAADIPSAGDAPELGPVDETIIADTLERLDRLVALDYAKQALHDHVDITRLERSNRTLQTRRPNLVWSFIGNTGTGKSTVAELLGKLLQGLGLLKRGHTVSLNAEELAAGDMYATIEKALKRAADGLLFVDMDSPRFRDQPLDSVRVWIERKLAESRQTSAVVFAEASNGNEAMAKDLASRGVASLYHSILFPDFTTEQLTQLLRAMLADGYRLELDGEAEREIARYIDDLRSHANRNAPVNARTMQLLAQTIAQMAQMRIAREPGALPVVTEADVKRFDGAGRTSAGRIGFR